MWAPLDLTQRATNRNSNSLRVFARLKPGVAMATAQAEVEQFSRSLEAAYPDTNTGRRLAVDSLTEKAVGNVRPALQVLLGAVGMVLLIACANVANLTLARATARQREIAVRVSLGAQRFRIIRQFLTESLVLSLAGGAVGLLLAVWGSTVLQSMLQPDAGSFRERLTGWNQIGLDLPVLGFTLVITILTGLLSGLAPALAASRRDVNSALKEGSRGSTSGGGAARLRKLLVAGEIAVALVLLAGAGLLVRSFVKLRALDPGFDPHNVISMSISLAGRAELTGDAREAFYRTVVERVQAVPGVQQAALVNHVPLVGDVWGTNVAFEGLAIAAPGREESAIFRVSRPGYFSAMRVRLLSGRDFDARDNAAAPAVVVINAALARKYFPNESPLGKRVTMGDPRKNPRWITIVGVIGDMKQASWADAPANEIFFPFLQNAEFLNGTRPHNAAMMLVVRTSIDAEGALRAVKETVWSVDRNLPLSGAQTLEHAIGNATWQTRFSLLLIGIFSALALSLAMIGIYGVMAYEVAQRTGEIGIRMALGAGRPQIAQLILGQSLPVAVVGILVGLAAAAALVRLMKTMLFGIETLDPLTFAVVPLLVLVVAAAAALVPARRAMRVDPITALRHD
jgi:putative ABC transport system permease protein